MQTVDQETVIVELSSDEVHQLNITASYIWEQFDGTDTLDQVRELVVRNFEIDIKQASADVNAVVEQLTSLSLLVIRGN